MFIVRVGSGECCFICAPAGYSARGPQSIYRDGTDPKRSSPEVNERGWAYEFKTHRSAARQGAKFASYCVLPI